METTLFSTKPLKQCESISKSFPLSLPSRLALLRNHVQSKLSLLHVLVKRATPVIRLVKLQVGALRLAFTNNATYSGVLLISLAPVFEYVYRLFNEHAGVKTDYWNAFYFLHAIGPHIYVISLVTGFILIPKRVLKYAAIIPLAYKFGGILWLATVTSNSDFHKAAPWTFIVAGFSLSLIWIMCFDWLMKLHFHKKEGTNARIYGIIDLNIDGAVSDEVAMTTLRKERKALIEFNNL